MAESLELLLPELLTKDFRQGWTQLEFTANEKKWNAKKQFAVIPTLLRGKLIDNYIELLDVTKANLGYLKAVLQDRAGMYENLLVVSTQFYHQNQVEKANNFTLTLKCLFKDTCPIEAFYCVVLQHCLTGLHPRIGHQFL